MMRPVWAGCANILLIQDSHTQTEIEKRKLKATVIGSGEKKKRKSNGKGCFLLTKYRRKKWELHAVLRTVGKK